MLHVLGGQYAVALGSVVYTMARHRDALESSVMMLCLEAQVLFHHHDYLAVLEHAMLSDAVDVTLHERELLLGLLSA